MDNVCVVNMWSVCLLGVWGARSVWSVWIVCACLGCMYVSGWPMMAQSPIQEQDPVSPTSAWKAVPKGKAPYVSLESLVGTLEQGFGAAKCLQVATSAPLVAGWAHFSQSNKIRDEILELNKDILDALLDVHLISIWKNSVGQCTGGLGPQG